MQLVQISKYLKTILIIFFAIFFAKLTNAQYISEIIEYTPAPGQFINTESFGSPSAAQSIIGSTNGLVSLGAYGGYIIFKFENPVENNPDNPYGIDFTVFGNPASSTSAEPGIVSVMKDENNNGIPDDTWYELAGSDYYFSSTIKNYQITYTNPNQPEATDVSWTDNFGNTGFVFANSYHTQAYYPTENYFPDINQTQYTLSGTKIIAAVDKSNSSNIKSLQRAFGYADNKTRGNTNSDIPDNPYTPDTEGKGGDSFDISWAVDTNGNYIDLDEIDFIRIHSGVNDNMAWLGEVSTEISGAVDITPDISVSGIEDMIVIKDLPPVLYIGIQYPLEIFAFHKGRLLQSQSIDVSVNLQGATIDENNILSLTQTGTLILTASFSDNPEISSSITVQVSEPENISEFFSKEINIFPNPADDFIQIKGCNNSNITLTNDYGKEIMKISKYYENERLNVSQLTPGIYFLKIYKNNISVIKKIIIAEH